MHCPTKVSGPSAGQEIAAVSLTVENELGRMHQGAAGGSQHSFPVVLTSGTGVKEAGRRELLSFRRGLFSPENMSGKRHKCGSDSGLGNGLIPGLFWLWSREIWGRDPSQQPRTHHWASSVLSARHSSSCSFSALPVGAGPGSHGC